MFDARQNGTGNSGLPSHTASEASPTRRSRQARQHADPHSKPTTDRASRQPAACVNAASFRRQGHGTQPSQTGRQIKASSPTPRPRTRDAPSPDEHGRLAWTHPPRAVLRAPIRRQRSKHLRKYIFSISRTTKVNKSISRSNKKKTGARAALFFQTNSATPPAKIGRLGQPPPA